MGFYPGKGAAPDQVLSWNGTRIVWITNPVPPLVNVAGAVFVEDPSGTKAWRRLRQSDVDPDFSIVTFGKTAPDSGTLLYRRGDAISGVTASASYLSGPPSTASIADTFGGSTNGSDIISGIWSLPGPGFTTGSRSGGIKLYGADGGSDPFWTATLTATEGALSPTTFFRAYWASDVYYGVTVATDIVGTDVFNSTVQAGFAGSLQRVRNQVTSFSPSGQYTWFLWPNEATYTGGSPTYKDQNGFTFATVDMGTVTIVRNVVTRTYRKIRSAGLLSSPFTVTVT